MSICSCLSDIFYNYRTEHKLTQKEMAELCGYSLRHYQDLEMGRCAPKLEQTVRLSILLDFSLDVLKKEVSADGLGC